MQDSAVNRILIIATVLVIIIVGTLTLLPIEKLRQILSPFGNKPQQTKVEKGSATPTQQQTTIQITDRQLAEIMIKIGYEPLWIGPLDRTGRTLLYRENGLYYVQLGQFTAAGPEGSDQIHAFIGAMEKLEDIPGSADKYIYVIDPRNKKQIGKTRLLVTTTQKPTILTVESLNLNLNRTENPKPVKIEFVGLLDVWEKYLPYILKSGDAIIVSIKQDGTGRNVKDKNGIFETRELIIHRFGGKDQIFAELGTELKKTKQ